MAAVAPAGCHHRRRRSELEILVGNTARQWTEEFTQELSKCSGRRKCSKRRRRNNTARFLTLSIEESQELSAKITHSSCVEPYIQSINLVSKRNGHSICFPKQCSVASCLTINLEHSPRGDAAPPRAPRPALAAAMPTGSRRRARGPRGPGAGSGPAGSTRRT